MTHALNLMLHCGADAVARADIETTPLPPRTYSETGRVHVPVRHTLVIDHVEETLRGAGFGVVAEAHGMTHDGNRYFGMFQVERPGMSGGDDYGMVVGMRNSHDKSFPATLALGSGVFVCDNLAFLGEVKLARKHTRYILRDFPQVVSRAVGQLIHTEAAQARRIEAYKEEGLNDTRVHNGIIHALDRGVIPASKIPAVLQEWREPSHPEFEPRTVWSFFNAFTEVLKGNMRAALPRTQALHGLCDSVCRLAV